MIPGLGRSPGGGRGHQPSILAWRIPVDRRSWRATVYGVPKSRTRLSNEAHQLSQDSMPIRNASLIFGSSIWTTLALDENWSSAGPSTKGDASGKSRPLCLGFFLFESKSGPLVLYILLFLTSGFIHSKFIYLMSTVCQSLLHNLGLICE